VSIKKKNLSFANAPARGSGCKQQRPWCVGNDYEDDNDDDDGGDDDR